MAVYYAAILNPGLAYQFFTLNANATNTYYIKIAFHSQFNTSLPLQTIITTFNINNVLVK
jgi:hypothetical protein